MTKLSILIPSLVSRDEMYQSLIEELNKQINECNASEDVEILSLIDEKEMSIGEKRNQLQQSAKGKYSCFFDDDDWPSSDYISKILKAIEEDKDCCSFTGVITFDGQTPEIFEHSLKYPEWRTNDTGTPKYERYPNHLNVIKTSIARNFSFLNISHGEDHDWSTQIHKAKALRSESVIEGVIYHYKYVTKK